MVHLRVYDLPVYITVKATLKGNQALLEKKTKASVHLTN
jgi:hypothetical protein